MAIGVPPASVPLPAHVYIDRKAARCVPAASLYYRVPELLMYAILEKEDGRVGTMKHNSNGSWDLGPAQINTSWLPLFSTWGISFNILRNDACTNVYAEGWVLRYNANRLHGDWFKAAMAYNVGANAHSRALLRIGYAYAVDVVHRWWRLRDYALSHSPQVASTEGPEVFIP